MRRTPGANQCSRASDLSGGKLHTMTATASKNGNDVKARVQIRARCLTGTTTVRRGFRSKGRLSAGRITHVRGPAQQYVDLHECMQEVMQEAGQTGRRGRVSCRSSIIMNAEICERNGQTTSIEGCGCTTGSRAGRALALDSKR